MKPVSVDTHVKTIQTKGFATSPVVPQEQQSREQLKNFISGQFNGLFTQLCVIFPGFRATVRTQAEFDEMRRQWVLAMLEGGIHTREQINAGLRLARRQGSDFVPGCGKFVAWCRDGIQEVSGLPAVDEVMREFDRYSANRGFYPTAEAFPWKSPIMYQIIPEAHRRMRQYGQTKTEVRNAVIKVLRYWLKRVQDGQPIPPVVPQIENRNESRQASVSEAIDKDGSYREKGREMLEEIRLRILHKGAVKNT
ncbi:DNA replication protein [Morganella morganii]|uniref:replication protein P n=1 Tax=Morganella morganii TaxID=582 RepID=UPI001C485581|nr:replication protein P [Morganella morganii]QXO56655.1 DNA replication protein [Morganella morganii]QXO75614.1 DNA replication protein [Morganella morganii]